MATMRVCIHLQVPEDFGTIGKAKRNVCSFLPHNYSSMDNDDRTWPHISRIHGNVLCVKVDLFDTFHMLSLLHDSSVIQGNFMSALLLLPEQC